MKNFTALFLLFFTVHHYSNAQTKTFSLDGIIEGVDNGKIELQFIYSGTNKTFSSKIQNHHFRFSEKIDYPDMANLSINDTLFSSAFFLGPGAFSTKINFDSLHNPIVIKGSPENTDYLEYLNKTKPVEKKVSAWYNSLTRLLETHSQKLPAIIQDSIQKENMKLNDELDIILYNYVNSHKNSYVALWNLNHKLNYSGYKAIYGNTFGLLNTDIRTTPLGIKTENELNISKRVSVGLVFPNFEIADKNGDKFLLTKKLTAKYTLIDFWGIHCTPCIRQFEDLKNIYARYFDKGFELNGISIDSKENENEREKIIENFKLTWPQFIDMDGKVSSSYLINVFPSNFLLDSNGVILKRNVGILELDNFLKEHL